MIWACYLAALALSVASLGTLVQTNVPRLRRLNYRPHLLGFVIAVLTLVLALAPPLDALGERLFSAHMVEHELFLYAIPLALLSAQPIRALAANFRKLPATWRGSFGRGLKRYPRLSRMIAFPGHPVPALLLSGTALWAWHAPALYDFALRTQWAHAAEHISFLATALVYWRPLLSAGHASAGLSSNASQALYLVAGGMLGGILGALIALSRHVIYTGYLGAPGTSAATVLAEQQLGGVIMWFSGPIFCGVVAAVALG
jgi:putative membrane protein